MNAAGVQVSFFTVQALMDVKRELGPAVRRNRAREATTTAYAAFDAEGPAGAPRLQVPSLLACSVHTRLPHDFLPCRVKVNPHRTPDWDAAPAWAEHPSKVQPLHCKQASTLFCLLLVHWDTHAGTSRKGGTPCVNVCEGTQNRKVKIWPALHRTRWRRCWTCANAMCHTCSGFKFLFRGLKLCMRAQDALDAVLDMREHDVPYHMRFQIDTGVRCGYWYDVRAAHGRMGLSWREDLVQRAEPRICAFDIETTKLPLQFPNAEFDQARSVIVMRCVAVLRCTLDRCCTTSRVDFIIERQAHRPRGVSKLGEGSDCSMAKRVQLLIPVGSFYLQSCQIAICHASPAPYTSQEAPRWSSGR